VANDLDPNGPAGPQPSRADKRWYFALMTTCIGLFVLAWAVIDRFSALAAVIVSAVALVIPPFAVIIANVASATDRRRPLPLATLTTNESGQDPARGPLATGQPANHPRRVKRTGRARRTVESL
jgi:Protein of unknown function (DUF3099)